MAKGNMKPIGSFDQEFYDWISELSQLYRQSQIKAAVKVNSEKLRFYWFVEKLGEPNLQQVVGKSKGSNRPQLVDDSELRTDRT